MLMLLRCWIDQLEKVKMNHFFEYHLHISYLDFDVEKTRSLCIAQRVKWYKGQFL